MDKKLTGSDLTRAMLKRGDQQIWCAVEDSNDKEAMADQMNNDFTARIVSFNDNSFFCTGGVAWSFAVPIKISAMTQDDVKF
ncbi:hypothetical protein H4W00_000601 [Psychrobacter sp. PL19]|jgi:hypothetical protein|uniref:hypothetical protein n=1 Tax=Psychrobacter sp. PL19 TaxID=2760711 RepID=UPI001AE9B4C7